MLNDLEYAQTYNRLQLYDPYEYQTKFHGLRAENGKLAKARLLMAANQIGKTVCGGAETSIHATGEYPEWWDGHLMPRNPNLVCSGVNSYRTRDLVQKELLGKGERGTGWIPKHLIHDTQRKPGIPNALEKIFVKRNNGMELATITLLGYEDGPRKVMGERIDWGWLDEEPPVDVWSQYVRGTIATNGVLAITATPEEGLTQVIYKFLYECPENYAVLRATWDDAPHITEERKEELLAEMLPHEREMRSKGEPVVGDSMVFGISDDDLKTDPFEIPNHWPLIIGVDFGGDHPFAVVKYAFDMSGEKPKAYITDCTKHRRMTISQESSIIKGMGGNKIPVAWPHDGNKLDKQSGKPMAQLYRDEGVKMLPLCFSNPPEDGKQEGTGGQGIEVGLRSMYWAMTEARFKVFSHHHDWFKEKGAYHRKDGKVVALQDDLMSASRYGYMSGIDFNGRLRFAKSEAKDQKFFREINPDLRHIK